MRDADALKARRTNTIEGWFGLVGALGFFAAVLLLGYQAFHWLKEGQWTPIPISSVLGKLNIDYYSLINIPWVGAQKIIVWLIDLPLSLGIIIFGSLLGALIGLLVHEFSNFKSDS